MKLKVVEVGKRVGASFLPIVADIFMPLLIWAAVISALRQIFAEWQATRAGLFRGNLVCGTDADCPPGYQCIGGRCLPRPS